MYPIMGGGSVDMWHDCMYVHCTLVATYLSLEWFIYNNSKVVATCNYNANLEKTKYG
jgi:hypothetical protein